MTAGLLAAISTFLLFLIAQVLLFHLFTITKRFNAMSLIWFVLLAAYGRLYVVFLRWLPAAFVSPETIWSVPGVVGILNGAIIYLLLFLVYCCFYFTDHSLSVAYMIELEHRPGKTMTRDQLKERFPHEAMLSQRLADLVANGYVVQEGEYYRLTPKGRLFAGVLGGLKRFLKLEPGG
jgi:hypothetical protein